MTSAEGHEHDHEYDDDGTRMWTAKEIARVAGVHPVTVRRWGHEGRLGTAVRWTQRTVRYHDHAVQHYLREAGYDAPTP